MPSRYRGRFAPSPTGPLHFGSLVAAVASYADARHHGGEWLLRIDDIDTPRVVPGAADDILQTLAAYGMHWDGEVVWQSRRRPAYHVAVHALRQRGLLYPCRCSRREIADSSVRGIEGYVYPGTCRAGITDRARALRMDTRGRSAGFDDAIQGRMAQNIEHEIGDFVIYRADGIHAYHLAAAVDDAEQGVTHIVRGADLLDSTPRQVLIQQALGYPTPHYAHVPVALDHAGEKLSKQTRAAAVTRAAPVGTLAMALRFLGQDLPDGVNTMACGQVWEFVIPRWRLAAVPRTRGQRVDAG